MLAISHQGEVISGSEVSFLSKDEEIYPQLTRLFFDFDFRVLAVPSTEADTGTRYLITYRTSSDDSRNAVTPAFGSLGELESYTDENVIDILHQTLFTGSDDET